MFVLVTGGSCSGKSSFAEDICMQLTSASVKAPEEHMKKYYIATMEATDAESLARIDRHRNMRDGKGFCTVEQGRDIAQALLQVDDSAAGIALVECLSNLVANEMFGGDEIASGSVVASKVYEELKQLKKGLTHLVIVTNNVFEDGIVYDDLTDSYLQALGEINQKLAVAADAVYEVVVGIPILTKGEKVL